MAVQQLRTSFPLKSGFILAWLASTFLFGLFMFTKGFFLTRIELSNHTIAKKPLSFVLMDSDGKQPMIDVRQFDTRMSEDVPWVTFSKAVLLIIDGLRYDFVEKMASHHNKSHFYENNMKFARSLVEEDWRKSRLFKFIADPPTTTMQRLKALTTGSLPTFVDAGANFASSAIQEDNLLFQLRAKNKKIVFMGDDTWTDLYSGYFEREYPYPSFDVKDLDTVDNGIIHHLLPEMQKPDWDVLIAHFLGVDHCGHRYGPNHPEMKRKLQQMDSVIKRVISNLDNDTLLYVFGDHGMTQNGDHGGDSENEITSALFFHSRKNVFQEKAHAEQFISSVSQINIVPTLALQLNVSIPFSNIGAIIEDFFHADRTVSHTGKEATEVNGDGIKENFNVLMALFENANQVYDFLMQYSAVSNDIPRSKVEDLKKRYLQSKKRFFEIYHGIVNKLNTNESATEVRFDIQHTKMELMSRISSNHREFKYFIDSVYQACFDVWAKFDLSFMTNGIIILALASVATCILQSSILPSRMKENLPEKSFLSSIISSREFFGFILHIVSWLILGLFHQVSSFFTIACTLLQTLSLGCLVTSSQSLNQAYKHVCLKIFNFAFPFKLTVISVYAFCLSSNSFILMENSLLLFLIQTLFILQILLHINECLKSRTTVENNQGGRKSNAIKAKKTSAKMAWRFAHMAKLFVACVCMRISTLFWSCREEQLHCKRTIFVQSLDFLLHNNDSVKFRLFLAIGSVLVIILSLNVWCRKHGNLMRISAVSFFAKLIAPTCAVIIILHWVLQVPTKNKLVDVINAQWVQQTLLPRSAYVLLLFSFVLLLWKPVSSAVIFRERRSLREEYSEEDALNLNIQLLFKDVRSKLSCNDDHVDQSKIDERPPPFVFGLHNVYSTAHFSIMASLSLVIILLLGDGLAPSVILMSLVVICMLEGDILKTQSRKESNELNTVLWSLLASYWFFSTGHHAAIPSIRFDAGFIGLQGDSSNLLRAFLILFNTFSSHVFFAMALPLLHIWHARSLMDREGDGAAGDDAQGELVLQRNSYLSRGFLMESLLAYIALRMLKVTVVAAVAFLHRRHLMVWKIFGPRFAFEGVSFIFSLPFILLGGICYLVVDEAVQKWIQQLESQCKA